MSHKFLSNASFHLLLSTIDQDFFKKAQEEGCPYCGSTLHQANYPRSPMGLPPELRHYYEERFSLCCDTCRKRTTPVSVRFFGRRWYPGPLHHLFCVLTLGINERRLQQVKRYFGIAVSASTWKRWRWWWREIFPDTLFWQQEKGLMPQVVLEPHKTFLRALLKIFPGALEEKMRYLLRFLSPLTGGFLRAV